MTLFKKYLKIFIILFLCVATISVYWPVRNYPFINFDDPDYVTWNTHVNQGISIQNIIWAFTTVHACNWHPITWISHMLDCQFFDLNPGAHHLINLFLHVINTLLLFAVFNRMTQKIWQSAFIAVLFAVHPLHVESVVWVSERKDVLSTFFFLLTLLAYINYVRHSSVWSYMQVVFFCALGLMSKPMLVTMPFLLLLLDFWPFKRFGFQNPDSSIQYQHRSIAIWLIREKIPLFLLSVISCLITFYAQYQGGVVKSFSSRISNALISYIGYIGKMIYPLKLAFLYPHPLIFPWWQVAGSFLILGIIRAKSFFGVMN